VFELLRSGQTGVVNEIGGEFDVGDDRRAALSGLLLARAWASTERQPVIGTFSLVLDLFHRLPLAGSRARQRP
jgi:hypothetical protein